MAVELVAPEVSRVALELLHHRLDPADRHALGHRVHQVHDRVTRQCALVRDEGLERERHPGEVGTLEVTFRHSRDTSTSLTVSVCGTKLVLMVMIVRHSHHHCHHRRPNRTRRDKQHYATKH